MDRSDASSPGTTPWERQQPQAHGQPLTRPWPGPPRALTPSLGLVVAGVLLLAAVSVGLPWALSLARLGWQPTAPTLAPPPAAVNLALEGDTAPALYEEGGPPIVVNSTEEARLFLRQLAPEVARAGADVLSREAAQRGLALVRVELAQLLLTREGQLIARYDLLEPNGQRRPAWLRLQRVEQRWLPRQVVIGQP